MSLPTHPLSASSPLPIHPNAAKLGLPLYRAPKNEPAHERSARMLKTGVNDYGHPLSAGDRKSHSAIVKAHAALQTGPKGGMFRMTASGEKSHVGAGGGAKHDSPIQLRSK